MAGIYRLGPGRPSRQMLASGFIPRSKVHTNIVGNMTNMFRQWIAEGYRGSMSWTSFNRVDFPTTVAGDTDWKARRSLSQRNILVGVTRQCWAAVDNISKAIATEFPTKVIAPMVKNAQRNMDQDYKNMMAEEPLGTVNKERWVQDNPADSDGFVSGRLEVNGSEREISYHGGSRAVIFDGVSTHSYAINRISYRFFAIDAEKLDMVEDRPTNESMLVTVAIPYYQRASRDNSRVRVFTDNNPTPGPESDRYYYSKIMTLNIHGRTSRKRDRRTGKPWKLWRAIEYGQAAGNFKQVKVKNVLSYREVPSEEKSDSRRGNTKVVYTDSIVTENKWTVFMSPQWKWWKRQAIPVNGVPVIEVDSDGSYTAGTAPIRRAIMREDLDSQLQFRLRRTLDDAMLRAGFRRGWR